MSLYVCVPKKRKRFTEINLNFHKTRTPKFFEFSKSVFDFVISDSISCENYKFRGVFQSSYAQKKSSGGK